MRMGMLGGPVRQGMLAMARPSRPHHPAPAEHAPAHGIGRQGARDVRGGMLGRRGRTSGGDHLVLEPPSAEAHLPGPA